MNRYDRVWHENGDSRNLGHEIALDVRFILLVYANEKPVFQNHNKEQVNLTFTETQCTAKIIVRALLDILTDANPNQHRFGKLKLKFKIYKERSTVTLRRREKTVAADFPLSTGHRDARTSQSPPRAPRRPLAKERMQPCGHEGKFFAYKPKRFLSQAHSQNEAGPTISAHRTEPRRGKLSSRLETRLRGSKLRSRLEIRLRGRKLSLRLHDS